MGIRDRIEVGFECWGSFVFRFRWATILIVLAFSGAAISQIPKLTIDTSVESFLHGDDPILQTYHDFRREFQRDDWVVIAIKAPDIFHLQFLSKLKAFHEDLENAVPHLYKLTSIVNVRSIRGKRDELVVKGLLEDWPKDEAELFELKERALAHPLYPNLLISEDASYTTVILRLEAYSKTASELDFSGLEGTEAAEPFQDGDLPSLTGEHLAAVISTIRAVMARHEGPGFRMYLTGMPVVQERLAVGLVTDVTRFLGLVLLASAACLFLFFRSLSGMILPLAIGLLSLLTMLGSMPLLDIPLELPTYMLPAFLLAVGLADSVHILAIFYQRLGQGAGKKQALSFALGHSGLAVVLTSITTAAALLSFTTAELSPVAHLGIVAPIGVMIALAYTLTLLPALIAVIRIRQDRQLSGPRPAALGRLLIAFGKLGTTHPWRVLIVFFGVLLLGFTGAAELRFSHEPMRWFDEGEELRIATEVLNRQMRGVLTLEVLFDTRRQDGLHNPELLSKMDTLEKYNSTLREGRIFIGKTYSIVGILKEIHQALNENRSDFYKLPRDPALVAQELLLFESSGSADLEDLIDSQHSTGRMTLKVPWVDAVPFPAFIERIEQHYREMVGEAAQITVTGRLTLVARTFCALMVSMRRSYIFALLAITPLMILLLGNLKAGLIMMVPNLAPIIITLGAMGWLDIPLDVLTMLVGSVAIGLAVDDTIHFMHNFRRYYDRTADTQQAVRNTLQTTGQALLLTTLVLCAGCFIFTLGSMRVMFYFGFLTGFALFVAFLADVILAPALVTLTVGRSRAALPAAARVSRPSIGEPRDANPEGARRSRTRRGRQ